MLDKAKNNELNHFEVDMSKFEDTTKFVVSIIKVLPYLPTPLSLHIPINLTILTFL